MKNPYTHLARFALKEFFEKRKIPAPPSHLPPKLTTQKAGAFVSLHQKDGSLRGCIGTFLPTKKNLAEEIIANALAAAFDDPRFPPLKEKELPQLKIKVDVLSSLKTATQKDLDPKKYGLLVSTSDGRKGLLLPNIPEVNSATKQFQICCQKGGISPQEKTTLQIFTVKRYS